MPDLPTANHAREENPPIGNRRTSGTVVARFGLEWYVCVGTTVIAVCLHVVRLFHAGALWRDEVGQVQLATLPTLRELWQMLTHDSFPLLFPLLTRLWAGLGFGDTDCGLRVLGVAIGIGMLATLWWVTQVLGRRKPLVALGFLAVNATAVQWGDSIRAYGLGALLLLITLGSVWRLVERPSTARFLAASAFGVLSVQCLYQNAFLLAAICGSATLVCLRHRHFRTALLCIIAVVPAWISLLPYVGGVKESQSWWIVEKAGFRPGFAWASFSDAFGTPPWLGPLIWIGMFVFAVWTGLATLERPVSRRDEISVELPLFAGSTALIGAFGFFLFLWNVGLPTQPWYWLPVMPLIAVCVQVALSEYVARNAAAWAWGVGVLVLVSVPPTIWRVVERQTNIDSVAHILNERVDEADLVVVLPWYLGVSFNRYYNGAAEWITIPPIADHRFHRYDLLKEKLAASDPLGPVLERVRQTLRAGKKVWIVGILPRPQPGETGVPRLPPAPHSRWGWFDEPYNYAWGRQTRHSIETAATKIELIVEAGKAKRVSRYENVGLLVASGYRFGTFPGAAATGFSGESAPK